MKKMTSLVLFLCVLGSTANAMQARLPKDDRKNFATIQKTETERFIAKKNKDQNKERSLKRSQERDKKYKDHYEENEG